MPLASASPMQHKTRTRRRVLPREERRRRIGRLGGALRVEKFVAGLLLFTLILATMAYVNTLEGLDSEALAYAQVGCLAAPLAAMYFLYEPGKLLVLRLFRADPRTSRIRKAPTSGRRRDAR